MQTETPIWQEIVIFCLMAGVGWFITISTSKSLRVNASNNVPSTDMGSQCADGCALFAFLIAVVGTVGLLYAIYRAVWQ